MTREHDGIITRWGWSQILAGRPARVRLDQMYEHTTLDTTIGSINYLTSQGCRYPTTTTMEVRQAAFRSPVLQRLSCCGACGNCDDGELSRLRALIIKGTRSRGFLSRALVVARHDNIIDDVVEGGIGNKSNYKVSRHNALPPISSL